MRHERITAEPARSAPLSAAFVTAGVGLLALHTLIDDPVVRAIVYVALGAAALAGVVAGSRVRGNLSTAAWRWIGLGLAAWVAGDASWYVTDLSGEVPYPSVADGFYLAGYPLLAAGFLALTAPEARRGPLEYLDAAIVALGATLLVWPFVFEPTIEHGWSGSTAVSLAYGVGDVVMFAILFAAWVNPTRRSRAVSLLALAILAIFVADALTYLAEFTPVPSESVTLLWLTGYVLVGAAALKPQSVSSPAADGPRAPVAGLLAVGVTLVAIPAAIAIAATVGADSLQWPVFVAVIAAIILLVVIRGVTLVRGIARASSNAESARQRLATVVDTAGVGILFRTDELMRESNKALQEMLGYSAEELAQMSYVDVVHPDEREEARAMPMVPAGTRMAFARRFIRRDGTILNARVTLTATPGGLSVAVIEDVTEREQLERQLVEAQKLEAVGRLAGGVAHDFNNLLTAVSGYAELLRGPDTSSEDEESIEAIIQAAAKAGMLTRQLLAFSRSNSFAPEPLDVSIAVAAAVDLLRRVIPRTVSVDTRLDADVPTIFADPTQVDQVLLNLAVNASDAMPDGGLLQITVDRWTTDGTNPRFAAAPPGSYCRLTVADNGTGMDEATRSRIFEPFFTTKNPDKGTGLGLSTIYGIVTSSGGHIRVDSEPGRGTRFEIILPHCPEAAVARRPELVAA